MDIEKNILLEGQKVIAAILPNLPSAPGTYRMLGAVGEVLYVGKANNLKKRVAAYTRTDRLSARIQRMVARTRSMVFAVARSEAEALLMEASLIKALKPRYNILMRDDKSYADILIATQHDFPRILKHRGVRSDPGEYFGPFASTVAVNETIDALQKAFMLRNCSDAFFGQRTRPCLQYHIRRCTAPCVGMVSRGDYAAQVEGARAFMKGKSRDVQEDLLRRMQAASDAEEYEKAAVLRDRLQALAAVQGKQAVHLSRPLDADVFAVHEGCVSVFVFRAGRNYGNASFFPKGGDDMEPGGRLAAFLPQYYEGKVPPPLVLVSVPVDEGNLVATALGTRIVLPQRGIRKDMVALARENARQEWGRHVADAATQAGLLEKLGKAFSCPHSIRRIEVYDNSHFMGADPVGAMVVAGPEGFAKSSYRKFNIRQAAGNDDFAMMREVFSRRFRDSNPKDSTFPDLLLIDGGLGQLHAVQDSLRALGLQGKRPFVAAIAKGPDRNAGHERIFIPGRKTPLVFPPGDPLLFFVERLRDEAHRFAIGSQRKRRTKTAMTSPLDDLPGIGSSRKRALIQRFGSIKAVSRASVADLLQVPGISAAMAQRIFNHFHA